jgi:hypothetical protein
LFPIPIHDGLSHYRQLAEVLLVTASSTAMALLKLVADADIRSGGYFPFRTSRLP